MNHTFKAACFFLPAVMSIASLALSGCALHSDRQGGSDYSERQAETERREQVRIDIVNARITHNDQFKSRWDLNDLKIFMTQDQIRSQFGDPDAIDIGPETETWYYGAWSEHIDLELNFTIREDSIREYSEDLKSDIAKHGYPSGGNRIIFLRPKGEQSIALATGWKIHLHNGFSPGAPDVQTREIPSTFTLSNAREIQKGMTIVELLDRFGSPDLLYYRSLAEYSSAHHKLPYDNWIMTYWVSRSPSFQSNDFWFSPDGKLIGWDVRFYADAN